MDYNPFKPIYPFSTDSLLTSIILSHTSFNYIDNTIPFTHLSFQKHASLLLSQNIFWLAIILKAIHYNIYKAMRPGVQIILEQHETQNVCDVSINSLSQPWNDHSFLIKLSTFSILSFEWSSPKSSGSLDFDIQEWSIVVQWSGQGKCSHVKEILPILFCSTEYGKKNVVILAPLPSDYLKS